jgi:aminoglycoside phosphotransferase (APT) family kinase protein
VPAWQAEIELDEGGVRAILGAQFPDVSLAGLRPFAEGWDNALWVTGEGIAFRFPRRSIAIPGVEREIAILPALAPLLPLPIPEPEYVGRPAGGYPWPFFGARLLDGREIAHGGIDDRRSFGAALGGFLATLHDPGLAETLGAGLPIDPMGRADMAIRAMRVRERLPMLIELGHASRVPALERLLDDALALPAPADPPVLVHGDLHVRHVLVADDGTPSAVIDWGDLCLADSAVDLALYWSQLDEPGRGAFADAYGGRLTRERLLRARVLAINLDIELARYAADIGDADLLATTRDGLQRALLT